MDAGANPMVNSYHGIDLLTLMASHGRLEQIQLWLDRFPSWDIDQSITDGSTALMACAQFGKVWCATTRC